MLHHVVSESLFPCAIIIVQVRLLLAAPSRNILSPQKPRQNVCQQKKDENPATNTDTNRNEREKTIRNPHLILE